MSIIKCFDDNGVTGTAQYVVHCTNTKKAVIIDSVWNYEAASGKISNEHVNSIIDYVKEQGLDVVWIVDTHVHADHITGADQLKLTFPNAKYGIGKGIVDVQKTFIPKFNYDAPADGSQFDVLFADGETFNVGDLVVTVISTPGHTPDSSTFVIESAKALFVGDTLFQPDKGTARCDFPNGSAETLYKSIQRILAYPDDFTIYVCHDYPGSAREFLHKTTVGEQKQKNIHVAGGKSLDDFVSMRQARDKTLNVPHLLLPSVQINMIGGKLPTAEANGTSYIKIPVSKV